MAKTDAPPRAAPRYAALGEAWRLLNPFAADGEGLQELAAMAMVSVARSVLTYFTATATSLLGATLITRDLRVFGRWLPIAAALGAGATLATLVNTHRKQQAAPRTRMCASTTSRGSA